MRIKVVRAVLLAIALLHGPPLHAESSRTFSSFRCSYTLPGANWEWVDETRIPNGLFVARDDSGIVLMLLAGAAPPGAAVTNEFMVGVERGILKGGVATIRAKRTIQFKSLACQQLELDFSTLKKRAVARVFVANGFVYQLQLLGAEIPNESSPELSKIMNGFEFLTKPGRSKTPEQAR